MYESRAFESAADKSKESSRNAVRDFEPQSQSSKSVSGPFSGLKSGFSSASSDVSDDFRAKTPGGFSQANYAEERFSVAPDFGEKFDRVWHEWVLFAHNINWKRELCGKIIKKMKNMRVMEHFLPLNIGKIYKWIDEDVKFGHLPAMKRSLRRKLGAFGAQRFCERIISAVNIVITDGNSLLCSEKRDIMVALRIHREWMK